MSPGRLTTIRVCDPRQASTDISRFGLLMSAMSKIRMPRTRSLIGAPGAALGKPPNPQSSRLLVDSDDMNSRFLYTDTSFCDAGQMYCDASTGFAGLERS